MVQRPAVKNPYLPQTKAKNVVQHGSGKAGLKQNSNKKGRATSSRGGGVGIPSGVGWNGDLRGSGGHSGAAVTPASRNMMLRSRDAPPVRGSTSASSLSATSAEKPFDPKEIYKHVEASVRDWCSRSMASILKTTLTKAWDSDKMRFAAYFDKNVNKPLTMKSRKDLQKEVQDVACAQLGKTTKSVLDKANAVS